MAGRRTAVRQKAEGAYHHGDLKSSLKHAALRLVREKGPRGFSLNEASRLAGVTVAAPYRHFTDKDALLADIACDGNVILEREVRDAAALGKSVKQQMIEAGMAYLRFARHHADYFSVMFGAGLDKALYPELERSAGTAFAVILGLAQKAERSSQAAGVLAVSAWALVHGLATLSAEGALAAAARQKQDFEHLRPLLERFLRDA